MKTTRLKCRMPGADPSTVAKVGRHCRAAQIPAKTSEVMFLPVLPPASLCSLAVRPRQSGSFALPILVALFLAVVSVLHAQSYSINWFKVAGGGGTSAGGEYQVSGTIGQPDAGGLMTAGNYSLTGGFWSVIAVVQSPGAPLLTITFYSQLPTVTVPWPASATNYVLQQNSDLTTANWMPVGLPVSTNGATLSVSISPQAGNLFFRLIQ
jgi:hypothetical protein